jgi:nitrite reductase/ring-hydroxylating ferredoxin subunit
MEQSSEGMSMPEMNRRNFLFATGVAAAAVLSLPVLQPSVHAAPPPPMPGQPIDVGELKSFDHDGVYQKFAKRPNFIFLVREDGKLYACLSMCTHRYRPLTVKDDEFYCPAHHSEFSFAGTVTKGPAEDSLPRYAISLDEKGHVMVDCSKEFRESKWDDAASFVTIK